jgi:hypothetical protein
VCTGFIVLTFGFFDVLDFFSKCVGFIVPIYFLVLYSYVLFYKTSISCTGFLIHHNKVLGFNTVR